MCYLMFHKVARILLNRHTVAAYKFAIGKVFDCVTNINAKFEHWDNIKVFIYDYSMTQHSGQFPSESELVK